MSEQRAASSEQERRPLRMLRFVLLLAARCSLLATLLVAPVAHA